MQGGCGKYPGFQLRSIVHRPSLKATKNSGTAVFDLERLNR